MFKEKKSEENHLPLYDNSIKLQDENYMKTFNFYCKCGFLPLFDLKPNGYEYNMTYMYTNII